MPEDVADSTAQLERLLKQIMKEKDPLKCHELGAEIWRILDERERFKSDSELQTPQTRR